MAREADHYTVDEAARMIGVSPARVRQMLRAGELEGERHRERAEDVPGPWRLPAGALHAFLKRRGVVAGDETTATLLPRGGPGRDADTLPNPPRGPREEAAAEAPSEASELLSEGIRDLRERAEGLLRDLERLEGRLEAAEVEQLNLREALRRERRRSEGLRAELETERARGRGEGRGARRGPLGK